MEYAFSDSGSDDPEDLWAVCANSGVLDKQLQEALDSALGCDSWRLRPRQYAGQTLDVTKISSGQNCWEVNSTRRPSTKLRRRIARLQSLLASRLVVDPLVAVFSNPSITRFDARLLL